MGFTREFTIAAPPIGTDFSGGSSTTEPTVGGFALVAGRTVVVGLKWESVNTTASVTDTAGNTYLPLTKQRDATNEFSVQLFYCLSTVANAANIWTGNWVAGVRFRNIVVGIYLPSGPASFVTEAGALGSDTHPVTAAFNAGSLAFCQGVEFVGQNAAPDASWTEESDVTTNASHSFDRIDTPGGTITGGFTLGTTSPWAIVAASFDAVPPGNRAQQLSGRGAFRPRGFAPGLGR